MPPPERELATWLYPPGSRRHHDTWEAPGQTKCEGAGDADRKAFTPVATRAGRHKVGRPAHHDVGYVQIVGHLYRQQLHLGSPGQRLGGLSSLGLSYGAA